MKKRKIPGVNKRHARSHSRAEPGKSKPGRIDAPPNRKAVALFGESRRRRKILRKFHDDKGRPVWRVVREVYKHAAQ